MVNNIPVTTTYDAEYIIYVTYDNEEYEIDDVATYTKYKSKVGEVTQATLIKSTYDNGKVVQEIILE